MRPSLIHPLLRPRRIRGREITTLTSVTPAAGVMMNRRLPGDPVGLEVHLRPSLPVGRKEANGQMSCSEVRSNGIVRVVDMKIQTMPNFWTGFRWVVATATLSASAMAGSTA